MDHRLVTPFIDSATNIIKEMTGVVLSDIGALTTEKSDLRSYGVTSVITFAGKIKGRFVIDLEPALAVIFMRVLMGEEAPVIKDRLMLGCISEINNIIAGDANTWLNNQYGLRLRLAPPIVFTGKKVILAASKLESVTVLCKTAPGAFQLNIAFQGGLAE